MSKTVIADTSLAEADRLVRAAVRTFRVVVHQGIGDDRFTWHLPCGVVISMCADCAGSPAGWCGEVEVRRVVAGDVPPMAAAPGGESFDIRDHDEVLDLREALEYLWATA